MNKNVRMQKVLNEINELSKHIKEYVQNEVELATLRVAEKTSQMVANIIATLVVLLIVLIAVLLAGIALSIFLNQQLKSNWIGYVIVALGSVLVACMVWLSREKLLRIPMMNKIIQLLLNNKHE